MEVFLFFPVCVFRSMHACAKETKILDHILAQQAALLLSAACLNFVTHRATNSAYCGPARTHMWPWRARVYSCLVGEGVDSRGTGVGGESECAYNLLPLIVPLTLHRSCFLFRASPPSFVVFGPIVFCPFCIVFYFPFLCVGSVCVCRVGSARCRDS